jgi:hypothetical protein
MDPTTLMAMMSGVGMANAAQQQRQAQAQQAQQNLMQQTAAPKGASTPFGNPLEQLYALLQQRGGIRF